MSTEEVKCPEPTPAMDEMSSGGEEVLSDDFMHNTFYQRKKQ